MFYYGYFLTTCLVDIENLWFILCWWCMTVCGVIFKLSFKWKFLALLLLSGQVCVVHSVERGPVVSEYSVSGTTYAPEGIIFDSTGMQVIYFL